jgi:hypothetical protein
LCFASFARRLSRFGGFCFATNARSDANRADARLDGASSLSGLKAAPSPVDVAAPSTPSGFRIARAHENASDAKTFKPPVESTKRRGRFLDRSENIRAKSKKGFADSGAILFRTALPIAITALPLFSPHADLAYIVAAQNWPIAMRQEY